MNSYVYLGKKLDGKFPGSIYYDGREHRTREDAIKFVKDQMELKGVDKNGLPRLFRKSKRSDRYTRQNPQFKPLAPRVTYHKMTGHNKTVKIVRQPYGCNPIVPNDIFGVRKWIMMTADEIRKFMREELPPPPPEKTETEKELITKEEILAMSDEEFRNLISPDIPCHQPKSEKELIKDNEILMNKFRADVVSSKTYFADGESSKKYLNDMVHQTFDYGVAPPNQMGYRSRRQLNEGSYPNWTVEENKLPKVLR